ncbi:hypothetical protein [Sphingopyxis macrogoltabida]|uniref:Uncharacterized protein n=1 Tax=Sphingopyxis macrogoltabida TaxID=33050 RepID=A0AAC8Z1R4_SPHMC|nr:hypothetical protein [Sphingopyxis macrogoltabida]ALJ14086.1 hypothetical protein LH19_14525 [Sphingopyxis macrogoltabida]AMU90358.1 hypothetical protein ATM17_15130 [Sphingopyxis macrogoltabida]
MKGSECCAAPCRFWNALKDANSRRSEDEEPIGQCRRSAPTFDGAMYAFTRRYEGCAETAGLINATSYPYTQGYDWCGEFEPDGFQGPC